MHVEAEAQQHGGHANRPRRASTRGFQVQRKVAHIEPCGRRTLALDILGTVGRKTATPSPQYL